MNGLTKKKLNLLVHLARVDGNFHQSEKEMLLALAGEARVLDEAVSNPLDGVENMTDKEEVMYLALKLIQADNVITEEELSFCRKLAAKLGFRENAVDHFALSPLPAIKDFTDKIKNWRVQGAL